MAAARQGWLVYIKSSLTGDENDYVRDYARRYTSSRTRRTGDQFFSEEQFEVYRALGFHIANGLLAGEDGTASRRRATLVDIKFNDAAMRIVKAVREALLVRGLTAVLSYLACGRA